MTYGELASLMGCSLQEAGDHANKARLDRRRSRDGTLRMKLDLALMQLFVARIRSVDDEPFDRAMENARRAHPFSEAYGGGNASAAGGPGGRADAGGWQSFKAAKASPAKKHGDSFRMAPRLLEPCLE
jgi:hypothetical protein